MSVQTQVPLIPWLTILPLRPADLATAATVGKTTLFSHRLARMAQGGRLAPESASSTDRQAGGPCCKFYDEAVAGGAGGPRSVCPALWCWLAFRPFIEETLVACSLARWAN